MSNLMRMIKGKGLPSNNRGQAVGRVSWFQNGTEAKPLIFSSGLVTRAGYRKGDEQLYLVEGHSLTLLFPGDEAHKVYLANEEDKTSYSEEAVLLVALPLRIGVNSQAAATVLSRLMAGEGQVMAALSLRESKGPNGEERVQLVGEMPFNDGQIYPITVLDPLPQELERAEKEGKGGYAFWIPMTEEMIASCKSQEEEEEEEKVPQAPSNPLARKKGTAVHKPVAAATESQDVLF